MSNLDVAVSSFWQLARHWKQGEKASLQLSCEDGTLHIQLSADLGHPEEPHFPQSPQTPQTLHPSCKRKSPSQLRRQERRKSEAISKAANKMPFEAADNSVKEPIAHPEEADNFKESLPTSSEFNCDQCDYQNSTEKGLRQHTRMKHKISQVDGVTELEEDNTSDEVNSPIPVREQETQTDVFLKVDDKGDLTEPCLDLLYDQPPPTVYHPVWGEGKYQKTDTYTENKIKRKAYCYEFENGDLHDV